MNRRYLVLLSDVLLIGEPPLPLPGKKPSGKDKINVKQARGADTEDLRALHRRIIHGLASLEQGRSTSDRNGGTQTHNLPCTRHASTALSSIARVS